MAYSSLYRDIVISRIVISGLHCKNIHFIKIALHMRFGSVFKTIISDSWVLNVTCKCVPISVMK